MDDGQFRLTRAAFILIKKIFYQVNTVQLALSRHFLPSYRNWWLYSFLFFLRIRQQRCSSAARKKSKRSFIRIGPTAEWYM